MLIVNLTPHDITIMNEVKEVVAIIRKSGKVARLETDKELIRVADRVPFFASKYGIPVCFTQDGVQVQFPEPKVHIIYIVSGLFRAGYARSDLWQPGELIRDEDGRPVGCIGLSQ